MTTDTSPKLVVETGVHRAARCPIRAGRHRVGPEPEDAIVVSDLDNGFAIDLRSNGLYLCAGTMPIDLADGRRVKPGRDSRCAGTVRFSRGDVAFRLEMPAASRSRASRFNFVGRLFGFAGGVLATATVSAVVLSRAAPYAHAPISPTASLGASPAPLAARPSGPSQQSSLRNELRAHLDALGLQSVATAVEPDGAIEVKGEISPKEEPAWRDVSRWFDAKAKGRAVLVDSVRVVTLAPPLAVRAVWTGRNPYVVDGDGERHFVGSVLATGWVVDAIESRQVVMRRGGQVVSVRY